MWSVLNFEGSNSFPVLSILPDKYVNITHLVKIDSQDIMCMYRQIYSFSMALNKVDTNFCL